MTLSLEPHVHSTLPYGAGGIIRIVIFRDLNMPTENRTINNIITRVKARFPSVIYAISVNTSGPTLTFTVDYSINLTSYRTFYTANYGDTEDNYVAMLVDKFTTTYASKASDCNCSVC